VCVCVWSSWLKVLESGAEEVSGSASGRRLEKRHRERSAVYNRK